MNRGGEDNGYDGQVKRPKKVIYSKIEANLQELVQYYQHQNMIDFLRDSS